MQLTSEQLEQHRPRLVGFAFRRLGDADAAEDAAQEALIQAWQFRESWCGSDLLAWLIGITRYRCCDHVRTVSRRRRNLPTVPFHHCEGVSDRKATPEERQLTTAADTLRSLAGLTLIYRRAVVRRLLYGWTYEEMAADAGLSVLAMRSRVQRGVRKVRQAAANNSLDTGA